MKFSKFCQLIKCPFFAHGNYLVKSSDNYLCTLYGDTVQYRGKHHNECLYINTKGNIREEDYATIHEYKRSKITIISAWLEGGLKNETK